MFAVINHLHFIKPVDEFKELIEKEGLPFLSSHKGFLDFYFIKETYNKAIVIILWEDAASAEAGAKSFGPAWFGKNLKPFFAKPEDRSTGEVIIKY